MLFFISAQAMLWVPSLCFDRQRHVARDDFDDVVIWVALEQLDSSPNLPPAMP
jgi:hypothetical protein